MNEDTLILHSRIEESERKRMALLGAGAALHERLEHWIQMNSGICDPKDVEAIKNWKEAQK